MTELLDEQPTMADDHTDPAPAPHVTAAAIWLRFAVAIALGAIIVASVVYLGVRLVHHSEGSLGDRVNQTFTGGTDPLPAERDAAMSQARQFALRVDTYGPGMLQGKTMPAYRRQVEQVITDKLAAAFDKNAALAEAAVSQTGVKSTAEVLATGVAAISGDSATVLVAGDRTFLQLAKNGKTYVKTVPEPFRWEVDLKKVDNTWLVDDFGPAESPRVGATGGAQ